MSVEIVKPILDPNKMLMVKGWLEEYLEKVFSNPKLRYMTLSVTENSGYIFVKVTDLLRPSMFLDVDNYSFNTRILFRQPSSTFYSYSDQTQKEFNEYIKSSFDPKGYLEDFIKNLK